jgi:ferric-dicitrate binding protein FerR (iron transport regulator)
MEKDENYYRLLLQGWLEHQSSPQEAVEIMDYLQRDVSNRLLLEKLQEAFKLSMEQKEPVDAALSGRVRKMLVENTKTPSLPRIVGRHTGFRWLRAAAAAAVILGLSSAAYFLLLKRNPGKDIARTVQPVDAVNDVTAGKNKAVLTLADGKQIVLDSAAVGKLAQQGNTNVVNRGGQIVYHPENGKPEETVYNTLTTARGESYSLVLADGSKLWLNASSSVRFPANFAGDERKIEITGEVYFEVAKDKARPFRVKTNDMLVEVLGTHFDINAYKDEATVNTTLLEGSVKIITGKAGVQLAPGQQSQLQPGGALQLVKDVNVDGVVAWKNGYFQFESADLPSILRQFSRWYDVDIVYEGKVKQRKFFGIVSRRSSLLNVLKMLHANDVVFHIEGRKLVVQSG